MSDTASLIERLRSKALDCHESESALYEEAAVALGRLTGDLAEADELLQIAHYAHQKLGLEGCGSQGLSHELRMFAMHFSQAEIPKTPQHVILKGNGRYWRFRMRHRQLFPPEEKPQS